MPLQQNGSVRVGQVWWDRDHRVLSQRVVVVEVRDDGKVVLSRGPKGGRYPRTCTVRADRLLTRFDLLEDAHA